MTRQKQSGFSLVVAIFLLVVVAGLIGYMVNLSSVQHSTVTMAVQGARAMQAARSGIDYLIFRAVNGTCNASEQLSFTEAELQAFTVTVECDSSEHSEDLAGGLDFPVYQLTATAVAGTYTRNGFANPDFVWRRIRATVSNQPP